MSRLALFILACALFASVTFTFASPAPVINEEVVDLEKRISHTGRGTYYYTGLGNCGWQNSDSDLILAISIGRYDGNGGANCGQWVNIEFGGAQAYGMTVDSCQSCGPDDIDMSPGLFQKFASLDVGEIKVTWNFMPKGWSP